MEIARWKEVVVGSSRRGSSWAALAAAAAFCAVIYAVVLCAKAVVRQGVGSNDESGHPSNGDGESGFAQQQQEVEEEEEEGAPPQHSRRWIAVKAGVANIVKKGGRRKLSKEDDVFAAGANRTENLSEPTGRNRSVEARNGIVGAPPLWQRRILMGEKCRLPNFSGLILYDEGGNPLPHHPSRLYEFVFADREP